MTDGRIVILSGGAGTRLWPLSRESFPKQFHDLAGLGRSLLADTITRLEGLGSATILTTSGLTSPTMGFLNGAGLKAEVVGEPCSRNTGPAVLLAAWLVARESPRTVVGVFPADHLVKDVARFRSILQRGFEVAAKGSVVTLGIQPHFPATAYGYMELESKGDGPVRVRRFIEKPNEEKARQLLAGGNVVWNAGMFLFRADVMMGLFEKHKPEWVQAFRALKPDLSNLPEIYASLKGESVDYAVMEKIDDLMCMPADIGWTDIGSWDEISKHGKSLGHPIEVEGKGNFYTGVVPEGKRVAFVGVSDLVAVDTPDALLVTTKAGCQGVKNVVDRLREEGSTITKTHSFEERPWGRFEVLMDTQDFKSKRITVLPGQKLSYQSHAKRAEHWVIVKGVAEVTLNDVKHSLRAGEHIHIPVGAKHRIANPGRAPMEFIEVQTGSYFGEDDIVRYSDDYGRTK